MCDHGRCIIQNEDGSSIVVSTGYAGSRIKDIIQATLKRASSTATFLANLAYELKKLDPDYNDIAIFQLAKGETTSADHDIVRLSDRGGYIGRVELLGRVSDSKPQGSWDNADSFAYGHDMIPAVELTPVQATPELVQSPGGSPIFD